mgnify:CR=1 FL=1
MKTKETKEEKASTALPMVASDAVINALDKCVDAGLLAHAETSSFRRTLTLASAIGELRSLLTPKVMEPIMNLQNTSLGFKTDQPAGYQVDIVRDCLIEACLNGVYPVGNEFNIICRQCYITKEGFAHKLRDVQGLSYTITPGIPRAHGENGAVQPMTIEWTYNGKNNVKAMEFAIRVNRMMGADAIIGKATRKARAWLFTTITGQEVGDGDVEAIIDVPGKKSPFEQPPVEEDDDSGKKSPFEQPPVEEDGDLFQEAVNSKRPSPSIN